MLMTWSNLFVLFPDIPLFVCNDINYGFVMIPLEQTDQLYADYDQLTNLKVEVLGEYFQFILRLPELNL